MIYPNLPCRLVEVPVLCYKFWSCAPVSAVFDAAMGDNAVQQHHEKSNLAPFALLGD
jgi:hypothetical protein